MSFMAPTVIILPPLWFSLANYHTDLINQSPDINTHLMLKLVVKVQRVLNNACLIANKYLITDENKTACWAPHLMIVRTTF